MLRVLSLGAGLQTMVEALMHASGELPTIDAAVFADTKEEPRAVYEQLEWLKGIVKNSRYPFPIHTVSNGNLWKAASTVRTTKDQTRRYIKVALPLHFVKDNGEPGRGMRTCTYDYKIVPINRKIREMIGRTGKQILESEGHLVEMLIGFTVDEIYRVKPNPKSWILNSFPLIEAGMSRADCYAWANRRGYPDFEGSACKFCPNRTNWGSLAPDEFHECVNREGILQEAYAQTEISGKPFFHETRVPLSQIKIDSNRRRKMAEEQLNLFINTCNANCGT